MRCTRPLPSPSPVRYSALCLTHRCNLRCTYCYSASEPDRRMSRETAVRAMDFLAEASHGKCTITFFGGEPLTELSLLKEIVSYGGEAHPGFFQFRMSTNGTLLDPATIEYLEANEIFFVLSLDGDEAQHDTNRRFLGGRGSFRKATRYLPQVLESNPYTLAVSVVAPNTVSHVARGVKDLFDRGFRYVLQTLDYSAGWETKHLRTLKAQYRELAEFYSKALKTGRKIYYSPFDERIKTWAQKPYGNGDLCDLANTQIAIAASGRIYPCVQFIGTDSEKNGGATIGDIFEGFDDSRRTFFIKENYAEKESCAGCALAGRCATYCGCVNWRATGDLKRIPTITCEHERMLMPIVDGMASALWKQNVELFRRKFYERSYPVSSYVEDCLLEGGGQEMLKVRRVRRYRKARYPRGRFRARRRRASGTATAGGLSALILLALTEACETEGGTGIVGPPPVMPEMVTETEARQVIRQVFLENGIQLQEDVPLVFRWATDSLAFDVDGYNTEMEVGFEYVDPDTEWGTLSADFKAAMSTASAAEGPYIDIVDPVVKSATFETTLEARTQAFIDALRAQGII